MDGLNPGTPMTTPPSTPPGRRVPIEQLRIVGGCLIAAGLLGAIYLLWSLAQRMGAPPPDPSQLPEGMPREALDMALKLEKPLTAVSFLTCLGSVVSGVMMILGRGYPLAVAGAIAATIPCLGPCVCLGLPFGIWALVLLLRSDVKAAFAQNRGGGPSPYGG